METGSLLRTTIEIGLGLLYLIGAIFNFFYTLRHGDEFYGSLADKALMVPSRQFIQKVIIPRGRLFTGLLIAFQLLVAVSILSSGSLVEPGLVAGAMFCLIAALVSNTSGTIANLLLVLLQILLAITR
jgi:hypothetical protein